MAELPKLEGAIRDFYNLIQRHVLGLCVTFAKGAAQEVWVLSAFLMSVNDEWVIITAGHAIDDVVSKRADGFGITRCEIVDGLATAPTHPGRIASVLHRHASAKFVI